MIYSLRLELISGMSLGIEFLDRADFYEGEEGWIIVLDLLILRFMVEKRPNV